MRVAYVCMDPGVPVFGCKGASVHVQEVIRTMRRRGLDVTLVARRSGGDTPPGLEPVRVVTLSAIESNDGIDRERALVASDAQGRGVLESLLPLGLVYQRHSLWACAALEYARGAGIPSVLEVNAPLVDEQARFRTLYLRDEAREMERCVFDSAVRIVCVSREVADYCTRNGADASRMVVVPNGVDAERFRSDVPAALEPAPGTITVGLVSTLRPWHGVELLVDAFARVAEGDARWRLLVVGDGPAMPGLRARLLQRRLLGRSVLTGAVAPESVPAWLTSMDIAVAPYQAASDHYYSPLKLFEYMAAGRAIVASRIGQVESVIDHGRTGLLCEPGDAGGMSAALRTLADDPGERARLGAAARERAVQDHSWDSVLERTLEGLGEAHPVLGGSS